jgi:hypothetical protein
VTSDALFGCCEGFLRPQSLNQFHHREVSDEDVAFLRLLHVFPSHASDPTVAADGSGSLPQLVSLVSSASGSGEASVCPPELLGSVPGASAVGQRHLIKAQKLTNSFFSHTGIREALPFESLSRLIKPSSNRDDAALFRLLRVPTLSTPIFLALVVVPALAAAALPDAVQTQLLTHLQVRPRASGA